MEVNEIAGIAFIANDYNSPLRKFTKTFLCLPAPRRPNTTTSFRHLDASQIPLKNSPSPLKPSVRAELLRNYPGPLRIHLPMIVRFGVELGYKGPTDAFILSKNLSSALVDTDIIDKKLCEDLALKRIIEVKAPTPPFIASPLGLVPKHDGGWRKIHHLSHPAGSSVNDYIPDGAGEVRSCLQLLTNQPVQLLRCLYYLLIILRSRMPPYLPPTATLLDVLHGRGDERLPHCRWNFFL